MAITLPLLFGSCSSTKTVKAASDKDDNKTAVVQVTQGALRGVYNADRTVEIYAGIPYAKPPVNELRWKEPQDPENWAGIFEADHYGPRSMQPQNSKIYDFMVQHFFYHTPGGDPSDNAPREEDSLYLNIWKPASTATAESGSENNDKLPVLFYIHGGSLTTGNSYWHEYNGENLSKENIIVVTIAYRLGVFGYYANPLLAEESPNHTTGNYGLLDQIKALEWVHNNIEAFGGDKDNITIAGESAGSSSVNAICVSPLAKGLFKRAIGESSSITLPVPPHTFRTMEAAQETGRKIMEEFNCTTLEELRNVKAEDLLKTQYSNSSMTIDGYAIIETPWETYLKGNNNETALINGYNAKEGDAFCMFAKKTPENYQKLLNHYFNDNADKAKELLPCTTKKEIKTSYPEIFGLYNFAYPHYTWTRLATKAGIPVYEYNFTKENKCLSTFHSGEMIYAYRNVPYNKYYDDADHLVELQMSSYWINFVKTGNPNGTDTEGNPLPEWKTAAQSPDQILNLGSTVQMQKDKYLDLYHLLDQSKLPEGFSF